MDLASYLAVELPGAGRELCRWKQESDSPFPGVETVGHQQEVKELIIARVLELDLAPLGTKSAQQFDSKQQLPLREENPFPSSRQPVCDPPCRLDGKNITDSTVQFSVGWWFTGISVLQQRDKTRQHLSHRQLANRSNKIGFRNLPTMQNFPRYRHLDSAFQGR